MTVTVLGVELDFDIYDVDVYEKYEEEVNAVNHKINEVPADPNWTVAEKLRYQCGVVKEFFDNVFGSGTSENIFHGKNNIKECTEAYLCLIETVSASMNEYTVNMNSKYARLSAKYAPEEPGDAEKAIAIRNAASAQHLNRAQRRNFGKKRKNH